MRLLVSILAALILVLPACVQRGDPGLTNVDPSKPHFVEQANILANPAVDADFAAFPNGTYRLYYAAEPIAQDRHLFVASSSDGKTWVKENSWLVEGFGALLDVVGLANGTWRMYTSAGGPGGQIINSLWSQDGSSWVLEGGARLDHTGHTPSVDDIAAAAVVRLGDRFVMVYNGRPPTKYEPNRGDNDDLLFWADSADGLAFTKKGLVLDPRSGARADEFRGKASSPDLAVAPDGSIKLIFWSNRGIYWSTFNDGTITDPQLILAKVKSGDNWPADPTLGRVADSWILYYNYHHRGVYYATYDAGK
jgi:hypothetical protein